MHPLWWKHVTAPPPQHYPGNHLEAELQQRIQPWSSGGLFHNCAQLQAEFMSFRRAVSEEEMMENPSDRRQNRTPGSGWIPVV